MNKKIFIGYDSRWPMSYSVTLRSLLAHSNGQISHHDIHPLLLAQYRGMGIYTRPTSVDENGGLYDDKSEAPMSTEFAISRFLIPFLSDFKGWSLFCDNDFLFRADVDLLFALANPEKAVMCVHHDYVPDEKTKMDGQVQTQYARKNWSSLMLFNNEHPANRSLALGNVNNFYGRDLHRFCWLDDSDIGELPPEWNWLEGHSDPAIDPAAVHYTRGTPEMPGHENTPFADEWRAHQQNIIAGL